MKGVMIVTGTLKIAGVLYILLSIPGFVVYARIEFPADMNQFLAVLLPPLNAVSAVAHGLGAIALGMTLDFLWRLRERLDRTDGNSPR